VNQSRVLQAWILTFESRVLWTRILYEGLFFGQCANL